MSVCRICIAQIPISIRLDPVAIVNLDEHVRLVAWCCAQALEWKANYLVLPEYTYNRALDDIYRTHSSSMTLVGGSYQSDNRYNETVIAIDGVLHFLKKIHLSPYEHNIGAKYPIIPSEPYFSYFNAQPDVNVSVLTCFDYYRLVSGVGVRELEGGGLIHLVFSPSCNDKPDKFFRAADAIHDQRETLYSVICNASTMQIEDARGKLELQKDVNGNSAIFGLYDKATRDNLVRAKLCDSRYVNMILNIGSLPRLCFADLRIPYHSARMGSREFLCNPVGVDFVPIPPEMMASDR